MANARGSYDNHETGGSRSIWIVLGLTAAIYALSPGARHFYKHGRLPNGR